MGGAISKMDGGGMGDFTPVDGFVGGLLIGLAVALMLLLNGRVAGISGILGGLLTLRAGDAIWRAAFVAGLVLGALAYVSTAEVPARVLAPLPAVLAGGLLVASGRAWARAAPAATASAAWRASPAAPSPRPPPSSAWRCSPCS